MINPSDRKLKEYIDSKDYFADAFYWYQFKYVNIFPQRSYILLLNITMFVVFLGVVLNIYTSLVLFNPQVKYTISADTAQSKTAKISRAEYSGDALISISDILVKSYIEKREAYDYDNLRKQLTYIKNNSTRIIFRSFYNSINIDNPSSPILKFKKEGNREVEIISSEHPSASKAIVKFRTIAKTNQEKLLEDSQWEVMVNFEIDDINPNLPSGTRFNFTITDYQVKLIKNNLS